MSPSAATFRAEPNVCGTKAHYRRRERRSDIGGDQGGEFSTEVDLEQVGKLTMRLCKALSEVDYPLLLSVSQDAFDYIIAWRSDSRVIDR